MTSRKVRQAIVTLRVTDGEIRGVEHKNEGAHMLMNIAAHRRPNPPGQRSEKVQVSRWEDNGRGRTASPANRRRCCDKCCQNSETRPLYPVPRGEGLAQKSDSFAPFVWSEGSSAGQNHLPDKPPRAAGGAPAPLLRSQFRSAHLPPAHRAFFGKSTAPSTVACPRQTTGNCNVGASRMMRAMRITISRQLSRIGNQGKLRLPSFFRHARRRRQIPFLHR